MAAKKNFVIVLVVLVATLAISVPAYLVVPTPKTEPQVTRLPMTIGAWQGKDIPIEESAYAVLETRNLVMREYTRGEDTVYLYIIYSLDNRKVSHPPEVCFEGSGVTITDKEKITLSLAGQKPIYANKLVLEKAGVSNLVVYWYKAGRDYVDNYLKQQLLVALARLRLKSFGSALIRLSTEIPSDQAGRALETLKSFSADLLANLDTIIP